VARLWTPQVSKPPPQAQISPGGVYHEEGNMWYTLGGGSFTATALKATDKRTDEQMDIAIAYKLIAFAVRA